jgi:hypothetical protein
MPTDIIDTTIAPADVASSVVDTGEQEPGTAAPRAAKKQKTGSAGASGTAVKTVKAVDPAIILQRRDAVQQRVLKLEGKLAKDRALLAKYSIPYPTNTASGDEESEDRPNSNQTTNA